MKVTVLVYNMSLEQQYQKKTEIEHIKDTPDMYIGSIEKIETNQYVSHLCQIKFQNKFQLNITISILNLFILKK